MEWLQLRGLYSISERWLRKTFIPVFTFKNSSVFHGTLSSDRRRLLRTFPTVGEDALSDLDESGIIRVGAEIEPNDLLVGKITPKGETQLSPEEKLLRAIFGEKAGDVRDTSLRVPPGVSGTVIGAKVFSREGAEKSERSMQLEETEIARLDKNEKDKINIIKNSAQARIVAAAKGEKLAADLGGRDNKIIATKGEHIDHA